MKNELIEDSFFPNSPRRILVVDAEMKLCPFQQPFMIPKSGGLDINSHAATPMYRACGSWCSLFELHRDENKTAKRVVINCGAEPVEVTISAEHTTPKGNMHLAK